MAQSKIQTLPEQEAFEQIVDTVQQAEKGAAPFALVLGSGFSHGLVPTARDLVMESLPLWMMSLKGDEPFKSLEETSIEKRAEIARAFWQEFVQRNANRGLKLSLNSQNGLPEDYSAVPPNRAPGREPIVFHE